MRGLLVPLILWFIALGCGCTNQSSEIESAEPRDLASMQGPIPGWSVVSNQHFAFQLPSEFKKADVRGTDSFVEGYHGDGIDISFDYGMWSNDSSGWPEATRFESVRVDGRSARIGSVAYGFGHRYSRSTQIHFASASTKNDGLKLSMFASCKSEAEIQLAHQIFHTIRFGKK